MGISVVVEKNCSIKYLSENKYVFNENGKTKKSLIPLKHCGKISTPLSFKKIFFISIAFIFKS